MERDQRLDRLELDDETLGYEDVDAVLADDPTLVGNRKQNLSPKRNAATFELDADGLLVDRFQEPWT